MFVVVYDKKLGCRWYNTQTGQIGGQWGATGLASVITPYLIRHAYLSRSGKYVLITANGFGFFIWDLATLSLSNCPALGRPEQCYGYQAIGYNSMINGPAIEGDMQVVKRPLNNISQVSQLV